MKNLTEGNPVKLILTFALPAFASTLANVLYNLADTVIVGNTVNSDALAGVGLAGTVTTFVFGFINGLTAGFCVRIAQRFGAHDGDGLRKSIAVSTALSAVIALIFTAITLPLARPLLILLRTPEANFAYAHSYLITISAGIAAPVFLNLFIGILRATGDSKSTLIFTAASALSNVGLDFLFIAGFKMNYCGAAAATVVSQFLAGVACLIYIMARYPELRPSKKDFRWDARLAGAHLATGLPMAFQTSVTAMGLIIQQTSLNGLNASAPGAVTAFVAASKIDCLANSVFAAIEAAVAAFAGQNSGAGKHDRVRKGLRASLLLSLGATAAAIAFCFAFCEPLMKLFVNADRGGDAALYYDEIIAFGKQFVYFQCLLYWLLGILLCVRNTLQGMGKTFVSMFAGFAELAGRTVTSIVFVKYWGFTGICLAAPAAWLFADLFLITVYIAVSAKQKRIEKAAPLTE